MSGTNAGGWLVLERLTKRYPNLLAVDALDLQLKNGEFLTLLGPSGSGKTTTLMMVAGFTPPTSGAILMNGRSIAELPPERRNIGVVFQNYALFPHMSVAENVAFPLKMRREARTSSPKRSPARSTWCSSAGSAGACRDSSRVANSSGWRSREHSSSAPTFS